MAPPSCWSLASDTSSTKMRFAFWALFLQNKKKLIKKNSWNWFIWFHEFLTTSDNSMVIRLHFLLSNFFFKWLNRQNVLKCKQSADKIHGEILAKRFSNVNKHLFSLWNTFKTFLNVNKQLNYTKMFWLVNKQLNNTKNVLNFIVKYLKMFWKDS